MKKKRKQVKMFTILNEHKKVLMTTNGECSINKCVSAKFTIVASNSKYQEYKKQETIFISRLDSLFK